jgi:hypothetical protein
MFLFIFLQRSCKMKSNSNQYESKVPFHILLSEDYLNHSTHSVIQHVGILYYSKNVVYKLISKADYSEIFDAASQCGVLKNILYT